MKGWTPIQFPPATPTHRTCTSCGHTKHASRFGDGPICQACRTRQSNRDRSRRLQWNYGITEDDYNRMLADQGGVCALCGRPPSGKAKRLFVDHDHETGKVRGLLCTSCNSGLGLLQDSPELMRKAAEYVEKHKNAPVRPPEGNLTEQAS